MTEADAITALSTDRAEADTLKATLITEHANFDLLDADLAAALLDAELRLAELESNIQYCLKYLTGNE